MTATLAGPDLREYQREALAATMTAWARGLKRPAAVLATGLGKCHRAGQSVLMFDGFLRAVEDVRVGDRLMGADSTPRTVLRLARGVGPMVEIRPTKGTPWVVNDEHLLSLVSTPTGDLYPSQRGGEVVDVTVKEWSSWSKTRKHRHKLFRVGVDFPNRAAGPIDPYILGIILGDGSLSVSHRVAVTTVDPEIELALAAEAEARGLFVRRDGVRGMTHHLTSRSKSAGRRGGLNSLVTDLKGLGLLPVACADRFVPDDYKLGDPGTRRALLAGLLDSDGSLTVGGYEFASKSERLAGDVAFIARSLGLAAYITTRQSGIATGHFRVGISGDCPDLPIRVERKKSPPRTQKKDVLRTGFDIVPTGTIEPFYGFMLDGDQRYLLDDFTVTHNTVIFAELSRALAASGSRRPLVLVHRDELVRQSVAKLRAADPSMRIGVIQGRECGIARTDIVVASVQTLIRRLDVIAPSRFDLGIVDEAHHAAADSYVKIMEHFGAFDNSSNSLWLGVTATMGRGDNRGLGDIWQEVVFERDIKFGVDGGFLVPAEVRTVRLAGLDTDKVKVSQGDLAPGALAKAMSSAHAGPTIARAYSEFARLADGRLRRGIVFAPKVETAQAWANDFLTLGIRCAVITGQTPTDERQGVYRDLAAGRLDVIASVMVLTEGFDLPAVEVAVIGRPTKSMALLTQMVGRVLRPSPETGKTAALVIDVVGAMGSGLARTLDLSIPTPEQAVAPTEAEVGERDDTFRLPEPEIEIPEFEFVALDLHGTPIPAAERVKGAVAPDWLRTYAGTPFLAATVAFPDLLFVRGGEGGPYWRKQRNRAPEPLQLAEGQDLRALHPGAKPSWGALLASDKQVAVLRRLRRPDGTPLLDEGVTRPTSRVASDLLAVHFASREIDR